MFKTHNSHHRLMSPYRLSTRHADGRSYSRTDATLFAIYDIIGGLLLGGTFFFVGAGIVGGFQ